MKISFATTCMGRLSHLQQTLPQNIRDNMSGFGLEVEFVVLNYGSQDGMHEWMMEDPFISAKIEDGTVRYARFLDTDHFRIAHAKNMAHRIATGDIICNLDADNFTGKGFAGFLMQQFGRDPRIIVNPDFKSSEHLPPQEKGFYGRIAISRKNFLQLGGYDEKFARWGGDDSNFRRRAKGYGLHHVHFADPSFLQIIAHCDHERVRNMDDPEQAAISLQARMTRNSNITLKDKLGEAFATVVTPVQANLGSHFGCGEIFTGLDQKAEMLDPVSSPKLASAWVSAFGAIEMFKGRFMPTIAIPELPAGGRMSLG